MKRFLLAISVVFLLSLGLAGVALADNGPHGNYTDLTDKCAACHRAHTGLGASLLTSAASPTDKSAFCYTCHSGGLGAYTDVKNGVFANPSPAPPDEDTTISIGKPLKGGGFDQVKMNVALTGTETLPVTSKHVITGGTNVVWGYGEVTSPTVNLGAANVALTCTNCHNPHGGAGTGNTATYRILKGGSANNTVLFSNGTVSPTASVNVPEVADGKVYFIEPRGYKGIPSGSLPNVYFAQHANYEDPNPYAALTAWCSQCHTRYLAAMVDGPGHTNSNDAVFQFRHGTNNSSACTSCHANGIGPDASQTPYPGCISCHVAHGTGARMGAYSDGVAWPDGSTTPSGDARSALLRLDNRGVCQACHQK